MNQSNHNAETTATDWHERLIDQALREAVGGETPPDLSSQILAAADEVLSSPVDERSDAMLTEKASRFGWSRWAIAATLLVATGGLAFSLLPEVDKARESQRVAKSDQFSWSQSLGSDNQLLVGPRIIVQEEEPVVLGVPLTSHREVNGKKVRETMSREASERTAGQEVELQQLGDAIVLPEKPQQAFGGAVFGGPVQQAEQITSSGRFDRTRGLKPGEGLGMGQGMEMGMSMEMEADSGGGIGGGAPSDARFGREDKRGETLRRLGRTYSYDVSGPTSESGPIAGTPISSESTPASERFVDLYAGRAVAGVPVASRPALEGKESGQRGSASTSASPVVPFSERSPVSESSPVRLSKPVQVGKTIPYSVLEDRLAVSDGQEQTSRFSILRGFDSGEEAQRGRRHSWDYQNSDGKRWPEATEGRGPGRGGDKYTAIHENPFIEAKGGQAVSTFSIDVDTASYSNMRKFFSAGQMPPADAIRIEELINYFDYNYEGSAATAAEPFASHVEVAGCPWEPDHRLVRIGIKGREMDADKRPLSNLVFLIDVSGSMQNRDKLPLVIEGLKALTRQLGENDRVAIAVYASSEGLVLPSISGTDRDTILRSLDNLRAGGSTAGGAGIRLAYKIAEENFIQGGTNRVILCTDGDFNVGTTSTAELERLVAAKAKETGVFLSVCGFGRGNLNDAMMETISGKGNGNYYYVDTQKEAEKIFVKGLTGTLVTIAKDVKIQVEFNPAQVAGYRLLGYENRMLRTEDFNDDKKDAGEIGAGHTVTALYEIVPAGKPVGTPPVDKLKYQDEAEADSADRGDASARHDGVNKEFADELLTLKMRYKQPDSDTSTKLEWAVKDPGTQFGDASDDLRFAAAVASFGMQLRGSQYAGSATLDAVLETADAARGEDRDGYRAEFVKLVRKAKEMCGE